MRSGLQVFDDGVFVRIGQFWTDPAGPARVIGPPVTGIAVADDGRVEDLRHEGLTLRVAEIGGIVFAAAYLKRRRASIAQEIEDGAD